MIMKIDVPVECGGVPVAPGDWIFGDIDGVCAIPAGLAEETVRLALQKVAQETTVRKELAAGESLRSVFARHQIL
jgi:regulator of RNase E activity RraA